MRNIREIILFLNIIRFSNQRIIEFIKTGQISELININQNNLFNLKFLKENEIRNISDNIENFNIEYELHKLSKLGIKFSCIIEDNYPEQLKNIYNPPAILYYKGKGFESLDNVLAIVGTRKPTPYGRWATKKIINELKNYDIKIVSGMALGIDYEAHNEAIKNSIFTIGILASSLEIEYPKSNKNLYIKMKDNLLISEFPLGTDPIKRNFVLRNRIISGLGFGTLVIEAADKSGSLITANFALEQNREVYAVPGNINNVYSEGCNELIKKGAKLVSSGQDIIEEIGFVIEKNSLNIEQGSEVLDNNQKVLELLKNNILSPEEIKNILGYKIQEIHIILSRLELEDKITRIKTKYTAN